MSYFRVHKTWPTAADGNPVLKALLRVVSELLRGIVPPSPGGGQESSKFEAMVSAFRVTRSAEPGRSSDGQLGSEASSRDPGLEAMDGNLRLKEALDGDPGPEGVHQDDAEITAVIMMNRRNVLTGTGGNRVWSLQQACGKPSQADLASDRLLSSPMLLDRFDALFLLDRKVKHEACPIGVAPSDVAPRADSSAVRDVLTFEVRRPRAYSTPLPS